MVKVIYDIIYNYAHYFLFKDVLDELTIFISCPCKKPHLNSICLIPNFKPYTLYCYYCNKIYLIMSDFLTYYCYNCGCDF